jgi:hypothetical protein
MYESGADGIKLRHGSNRGDAEFLATLKAIEILRKMSQDVHYDGDGQRIHSGNARRGLL